MFRMDLFDTSAYFATRVPLLATTRPVIKTAVSALAAKYLHRGERSCAKNKAASPTKSRLLECRASVDWNYVAAGYYQQAIGYLKAATNDLKFSHDDIMGTNEAEVLFASVVILTFYELIDGPSIAWKARLYEVPLSNTASGIYQPFNGLYNINRQILWSLTRQDVLCACMSST